LIRWASEVRLQHDIKQEFATRYGLQLINVPWASETPTSVDALAGLLIHSPDLAAYAG
jgi:hypothetical protein